MKPSIIQERNTKQDIRINAILDSRKPLANQDFSLPCLVEEKPKKHYYRGKVEPLYRIAYTIAADRKLEKGEKLYKKCCTENCSEPTHFYSVKDGELCGIIQETSIRGFMFLRKLSTLKENKRK